MKTIKVSLINKIAKEKLFNNGDKVIVATSGGADSMALLVLLKGLALEKSELNLEILAVHVQHHIRGTEAESDALFVEEFCKKEEIPFYRVDVDALSLAKNEKLSLEDAARRLRYEALESIRVKTAANWIVTAHHQDDQAETVLLNLLRGASAKGLRGMQVRNGFIVRPILFMPRSKIEEFCKTEKISYCFDSTNNDITYKRNKVRKVLLPLLEEFNPQIKKSLAQTAQLLTEDEACLTNLARSFVFNNFKENNGEGILELKEFYLLDKAIASRVIKIVLYNYKLKSMLSKKHIEAVLKLIKTKETGKRLDLPSLQVSYAYDRLRIVSRKRKKLVDNLEKNNKEADNTNTIEKASESCAFNQIDFEELADLEIVVKKVKECGSNPKCLYYPCELASAITLRNRQPGDYFRPEGGRGRKKLKGFFIDEKISREIRNKIPLVVSGSEVLWVLGYKKATWDNKDNKIYENYWEVNIKCKMKI